MKHLTDEAAKKWALWLQDKVILTQEEAKELFQYILRTEDVINYILSSSHEDKKPNRPAAVETLKKLIK